MTNRSMPSEEYRRKLRERHVLEGFCLACSAVMLVLGVVFLLDIDRSLWVPETMVVLGGVLNFALAIRAALVKSWLLAAALLSGGCVCFGLLAWLNWT